MRRALILVLLVNTLYSCSNKYYQENSTVAINVDSSMYIYSAAFKICLLEYELQDAEDESLILECFTKDTIGAEIARKKTLALQGQIEKIVFEFIKLTNFGAKNLWDIDTYANYLRIQYLRSHLEEKYFLNHETKIMSISRGKKKAYMQYYQNVADTSESFLLSSVTMDVLKEIQVNPSLIDYKSLKYINALVRSFGDLINPNLFPCFLQNDEYNCGPACLKSIADHYNTYFSMRVIEELTQTDTAGTTFKQLAIAAGKMGFEAKHRILTFETISNIQLPIVVHWNNNHFVVLYEFTKDKVKVANPASGSEQLSYEAFKEHWLIENHKTGHVLEIKPKISS